MGAVADKTRPMQPDVDVMESDSDRYIRLIDFMESREPRTCQVSGGACYKALPFTAVNLLLMELEDVLGGLGGKRLLDFGAGDLRVSLAAANFYGMNATAVEQDHRLSEHGRRTLSAVGEMGFDGVSFMGDTDGLNIPWKDCDAAVFYYTQPLYEADAAAFRRRLQDKVGEMKKGSVFAAVFTEKQLEKGWDEFPDMKPLDKSPTQLQGGDGLYLKLYRHR